MRNEDLQLPPRVEMAFNTDLRYLQSPAQWRPQNLGCLILTTVSNP